MSRPPLQPGMAAARATLLIDALRDGEPDEELLRAAVDDADALVGPVITVLEAAAAGEELDEGSDRLAFYGVHVLAAAGLTELWQPLLACLRLPDEKLDALFGDAVTETFPSVLLAVFDGDAAPAAAFIADPEASGGARWTVAEVLAELAVLGRVERPLVVEALAAAAATIGEDESAWLGWHEAVLRMRAAELVPLAHSLWETHRDELFLGDEKEIRGDFAALEADPSSPPPETSRLIEPLTDPTVALAFGGGDPAAEIALSPEDKRWLAEFLVSPACRPGSMNFEMLDGFLAGLVAGPDIPGLDDVMHEILDGGFRPGAKVSRADRKRFEDLIQRQLTAIDTRLASGVPHRPFVFPQDVVDSVLLDSGETEKMYAGQSWAAGFMAAVRHFERKWTPAFEADEDLKELIFPITVLAAPAEVRAEVELTDDVLREAADQFSDAVTGLYAYWSEVAEIREADRQVPARSTKVGRNEPCPCGSGRKFKKCCGVAATLH